MDAISKKKWAILLSSLILILIVHSIILFKQVSTINTSNLGNLGHSLQTKQTEQINHLLHEIKSIKEILVSSGMNNIFATDLSSNNSNNKPISQEVNYELLFLIEKTIQDELKNIRLTDTAYNMARSLNDSESTQVAISSQYDEQASSRAEEKIDVVIEDAVDNGFWSEDKNTLVMEASSLLKPEARLRLQEKLATAVNSQQISLSESAIPMF